MNIEELKALRADGKFHHATYRDIGTLWEGLWIYEKDEPASDWKGKWHPGYKPAGCFEKGHPDLDAAHEAVRDTGISVGRYGAG